MWSLERSDVFDAQHDDDEMELTSQVARDLRRQRLERQLERHDADEEAAHVQRLRRLVSSTREEAPFSHASGRSPAGRPPSAGSYRPPSAGLQRPSSAGQQRPGATRGTDARHRLTASGVDHRAVKEYGASLAQMTELAAQLEVSKARAFEAEARSAAAEARLREGRLNEAKLDEARPSAMRLNDAGRMGDGRLFERASSTADGEAGLLAARLRAAEERASEAERRAAAAEADASRLTALLAAEQDRGAPPPVTPQWRQGAFGQYSAAAAPDDRSTVGTRFAGVAAAAAATAGEGEGEGARMPCIIVVGSANVDLTAHVRGKIDAGTNSVLIGLPGSPQASAGGRGLNQAVTCARIGVPTHLVAQVGADPFGELVRSFLQRVGGGDGSVPLRAHLLLSERDDVSTGVALQLISDVDETEGQRLSVPCLGANQHVGAREVEVATHLFDRAAAEAAARAAAAGSTRASAMPARCTAARASETGASACVLALEIPLEVNRQLAAHAVARGCMVALKPSPLSQENVSGVCALLQEGCVHILCATNEETGTLLRMHTPPKRLVDVEAAAVALMAQFRGLSLVLIRAPAGVVVRHTWERAALTCAAPQRAAAAEDDVAIERSTSGLMLPARRLIYSHQRGASRHSAGKGAPANISGAADAMYGGLVAALSLGLDAGAATVIAYACGQMCATLPTAQLEEGRHALGALLRLELGATGDAIASRLLRAMGCGGEADDDDLEPDDDSSEADGDFLRQSPLHVAAMLCSPARLPQLMATRTIHSGSHAGVPENGCRVNGAGPDVLTTAAAAQHRHQNQQQHHYHQRSKGLGCTTAQLQEMLLSHDAFGFTPLQRVNDVLEQSRKGSIERKLCRRVMEWMLAASALIAASSGNAHACLANPLLSDGLDASNLVPPTPDAVGRSAPAPRSREAGGGCVTDGTAPASSSEGARPSHRHWAKLRGAVALTSAMWQTLASVPVANNEIFNQHLAHIQQIDTTTLPESVDDATVRLATFVVISILDDCGHNAKEAVQRRMKGAQKRLHRSATALGSAGSLWELEAQREQDRELAAADVRELALVQAFCVPVLEEGLALARECAPRMHNDDPPPADLTPFCRMLLECRHPHDGRSLLLLASSAGATAMVELLLGYAECGRGWVDVGARGRLGETALYEATAAGQMGICKMLITHTVAGALQLSGASAETLHGLTPATVAPPDFIAQLRSLQGRAPYVCSSVPGDDATLGRVAEAIRKALKASDVPREWHAFAADCLEAPATAPLRLPHSPAPKSLPRSVVLAVRKRVASCSTFVLMITPSLWAAPLTLIATLAAYEFAKPIVGVLLDREPPSPMSRAGATLESVIGDVALDLADFLERKHPRTLQAVVAHDDLAGAGRRLQTIMDALVGDRLISLPAYAMEGGADGLTLDAESQAALKRAISAAKPNESAVAEARSRVLIRERLAKRMTRSRFGARVQRKSLAAQARLLRRTRDRAAVVAPTIPENGYHVFLSHRARRTRTPSARCTRLPPRALARAPARPPPTRRPPPPAVASCAPGACAPTVWASGRGRGGGGGGGGSE